MNNSLVLGTYLKISTNHAIFIAIIRVHRKHNIFEHMTAADLRVLFIMNHIIPNFTENRIETTCLKL